MGQLTLPAAVESGELTLRLIRCLAPVVGLGLMIVAAATPARALDAVSVRSDAPAIDLTAVLEHQHSDSDRIQVSTAPARAARAGWCSRSPTTPTTSSTA